MSSGGKSSPVLDHLEELRRKYAGLRDGKVATYIPELAKANPDWFGICLVTAGGAVYEVGDSRLDFTIQSISKPFVYGMALEDHGRTDVLKKIGVEPSGDAFNAISLNPLNGCPRNPMINAGAIATAGMVAGRSPKTRIARIVQTLSLYAGRELSVDQDVYRSESATGHRNRAIGHMLRNFDILTDNPDPVVDLYFKQCSVAVNCRDLAVMAATLANHGVNPMTGKQAIRGEYVESVLSVMGSCGMYDFAGEWVYKVGMPAKSGVSGGIIVVLPGQLGIGVFSPLLDEHGNSVRSIRVCEDLSRSLDLHLFNPPHAVESSIRLKFTGAEVSSNRLRTASEGRMLRASGSALHVYELQGKMVFATTEVVVRDVTENSDDLDYLIFDFRRVVSLNECACGLFISLISKLSQRGKIVLFTHVRKLPMLRRSMKLSLREHFDQWFRTFDDNDLALEWCENRILERDGPLRSLDAGVERSEYQLFHGMSAGELTTINAFLARRSYRPGEIIINLGDPACELFIVARGSVSVNITLSTGSQRRLATLTPGMTFGELAVIDGARRSATVIADSEVECDLLKVEDFNRLIDLHPRIKIALLKNVSLDLCLKLRKANRELSVFDH